jgi:hypothetical protein
MAAKVRLSVEVQGDDIVVSLPDTSYVVTYCRAAVFPQQLLTKSHHSEPAADPRSGPAGLSSRPANQDAPLAGFGMSRYHSPH